MSTKKEDQTIEGYETIFSATGFGQKSFLDSLTTDDSFTVISGIFPDDRFIDYLHQQHNVEYIETNQVYKAQTLRPLQDYMLRNNTENHTYLQRVNELSLMKKRGAMQTAAAPNWGQARVTQRQKGDLKQYSYDDASG